jgi:hypothetical protein
VKKHLLVVLAIIPLLLTACNKETAFKFHNKAECGTATITITNTKTDATIQLTVDEGETAKIKISPSVVYNYTVEYAGYPEKNIQCDTKIANTEADDGQTVNIDLLSVTPTPSPG